MRMKRQREVENGRKKEKSRKIKKEREKSIDKERKPEREQKYLNQTSKSEKVQTKENVCVSVGIYCIAGRATMTQMLNK